MRFIDFINLYDNWNGITRVNDNNLNLITEGNTCKIAEERTDLHNAKVIAFGFYEGALTVRLGD